MLLLNLNMFIYTGKIGLHVFFKNAIPFSSENRLKIMQRKISHSIIKQIFVLLPATALALMLFQFRCHFFACNKT